jgi:hypothetical protein
VSPGGRHRSPRRPSPTGGGEPAPAPPAVAKGLTTEVLAKELDAYSTAISTQIRNINLGVLGLSWLLLLRDEKLGAIAERIPQQALLAISGFCIAAMALDLGQYLLAERFVGKAFDEAEKHGQSDGYDTDSWAYRGHLACYYAKVSFTAAAAIALVGLTTYAVL